AVQGVYKERLDDDMIVEKIDCFPKERYCPALVIYPSGMENPVNALNAKIVETAKLSLHASYTESQLSSLCSPGFEYTGLGMANKLKCEEKDEQEGAWTVTGVATAGASSSAIEFARSTVVCTRKQSSKQPSIPNAKIRLPNAFLPHLPMEMLPGASASGLEKLANMLPAWKYGDRREFSCDLGYKTKWDQSQAFNIVYDLAQDGELDYFVTKADSAATAPTSTSPGGATTFSKPASTASTILERFDESKSNDYCVKLINYCPPMQQTEDLTPRVVPNSATILVSDAVEGINAAGAPSKRVLGDKAELQCAKPYAFEIVEAKMSKKQVLQL
ncbi:unnamed protein product, partial [Amoebophrya sp. A120]